MEKLNNHSVFPKEASLRPRKLDDFIGQELLKKNLKVFLQAAFNRGDNLDHILLGGPPGLGKTSLAQIIANEFQKPLFKTSGPVLERQGDIASILTSLDEPHGFLFIDEIHRMNHSVEEMLYPAMEDFYLDVVVGQGIGAKSVKVDLERFTLIGATTRVGLLSSPLRDRFGIFFHLDFYSATELSKIIFNSAQILNLSIEQSAAIEIGKRSRGTPRIANRLLKRVSDFSSVENQPVITLQLVKTALQKLRIDFEGLDELDQKILRVIVDLYQGGPVGIQNLCTVLSEEQDIIENYKEPFLIRQGFLQRTNRGRVITKKGRKHLSQI